MAPRALEEIQLGNACLTIGAACRCRTLLLRINTTVCYSVVSILAFIEAVLFLKSPLEWQCVENYQAWLVYLLLKYPKTTERIWINTYV